MLYNLPNVNVSYRTTPYDHLLVKLNIAYCQSKEKKKRQKKSKENKQKLSLIGTIEISSSLQKGNAPDSRPVSAQAILTRRFSLTLSRLYRQNH